jgi:hypothetical protein
LSVGSPTSSIWDPFWGFSYPTYANSKEVFQRGTRYENF